MGEIVRLSSIRRLGFPKRLRISLICFDDLATSFVNLVNFGLVTPEFKIDTDVHFVVLFKKTIQTYYLGTHRTDFHPGYSRELILDY